MECMQWTGPEWTGKTHMGSDGERVEEIEGGRKGGREGRESEIGQWDDCSTVALSYRLVNGPQARMFCSE